VLIAYYIATSLLYYIYNFIYVFKTITTDNRKSNRNVCTSGGGRAVFSATCHEVTPNAAVFGDREGKLQIPAYFRVGLSIHTLQL
jgi:hypothetical protein